ncbi:hypothetical protein AKJ53_00950 [candidate division MSBL1 archaeon SCGC-AAA382F02]|uniref:WYL domain-containing protein n=1 Tax=candidate division MSBL1 archaeon SCGC-AAA382F02 TaxID=1698282 RepID=A0A133VIL5_9EURY|nr:hypothetical protein AKJ53_00950 [candidate division MSBL1 archaeon SCGC-AAA382F02]
MNAASSAIHEDLGVVTERLIPFAPRGETREKLWELHEEYKAKVSRLDDLFDGERLSCPWHGDNDEVIITGNGKRGTKKFKCEKWHDPDLTGRDTTEFRFSTFTSYEAYKVYQDFLTEALTLMTTCEGTLEGISKYLNISKYMVELSEHTLLDYLGDNGKDVIEVDDDPVVVFADFSGTQISKNTGMIMSKVGDNVPYKVCPTMNYMTAWNFVKGLKKRLETDDDTPVVFVTDGGTAWLDPIQSLFPDAVHIRQFHSKNTRGIIYVHLRHDGEPYTVRFPWDAVLEEGEASEDAERMRKRRKLGEDSPRSGQEWTELSEDIIVWEGIAKYPRGRRKKDEEEGEGATVPEAMDGEEEPDEPEDPEEKEDSEDGKDDSGESEETSEEEGEKEEKMVITSGTATPERIFKGKLEEAKEIPPVKRAFSILKEVFGGHYITSNKAEALFNVKPPLKAHRTMKNGKAFAQILLYLRTKLRNKNREDIKSFFRNEVVTYDRLRKVSVKQLGLHYPDTSPEEDVLNAHLNNEPVTIIYKDRKGTKTSRMIEPLKIETDPYSGVRRIKSYCHLRQAERTFLLERVVDAIPANTELSVISKDSL